MTATSIESLKSIFEKLTYLFSIVVAIFAFLAIAGPYVEIEAGRGIGSEPAATSLPSAIALFAGAMIGILLVPAGPGRLPRWQWLRSALAGLLLAFASGVLLRYAIGVVAAGEPFGASLGTTSIATATCLWLFGAGALAFDLERPLVASACATAGLVIVEVDLVGHLYGVDALARVAPFATMALPTAIAQGLLFVAMLLARPNRGWTRLALEDGQAGTAFRLMMPAVVFVPLVAAGLVSHMVDRGAFDAPFGFAVLAVITSVILGAIVCFATLWLMHVETQSDRLAAIVESSDDAIIGETLDGIITSWNRGAERLFGYSASEAIGQPILLVTPEERHGEQGVLLDRIRRGERVTHFETVRRRRDGTAIDVSASLSPVRGPDGRIVGASSIKRDITDLKRRDAELARSNAELEQFAYVASHDLQEPLRMVANYTELLAQRYQGRLDERADKYIHYASDGARRMQRMVADLLAYSRVGSRRTPLAQVSAQEVVAYVHHTLGEALAEANGTLEYSGLPTVLADDSQLGQVFQNLIGNALKFRSDAAPRVRIDAVDRGQMWQFSVVDNGVGMELADATRIFQMFQRLHPRGRYEGSGIGLAIVKRIVERHGGEIWVESAVGMGSSFHFTLPKPVGDPAEEEAMQAPGLENM